MISFDKENHIYKLEGKEFISVTQLLKKHGLSSDFSFVDEKVLNRKAERGTLIHQEIENLIKNNSIGFTKECDDFIALSEQELKVPVELWKSEQIVHNDFIAGTVDLFFYRDSNFKNLNIIGDIKTSTKIDKQACAWQLSIYEKLLNIKFDRLLVFHLCEKSKIIEIERIPDEEICKLFDCEKQGAIYKRKELIIPKNIIAQIQMGQDIIQALDEQKKQAEQNMKELKDILLEAMQKQSVKSFENEHMKITYVDSSKRESIDTSKLKEELPDIAKKYIKTSEIKANVRITLRS